MLGEHPSDRFFAILTALYLQAADVRIFDVRIFGARVLRARLSTEPGDIRQKECADVPGGQQKCTKSPAIIGMNRKA